jgi:hypothetical protein
VTIHLLSARRACLNSDVNTLWQPSTSDPPKDHRGRHEGLIFLDEIDARYTEDSRPSEELVTRAINAINENEVITAEIIRREITNAERALKVPVTEPLPAPADTARDRFLALLANRRGAYWWQSGDTPAFRDWLNSDDPLAKPLSVDAKVNCWEAVLAVAAEAKLVSIDQLRAAYKADEVGGAVYKLLTARGATPLSLTASDNKVKPGDVVLVSAGNSNVHHVVAVMKANPDAKKIEVMSLWGTRQGGCFTKATLDSLQVPSGASLSYSSLDDG